ncbi:hypothetical protein [Nguyenibacter sp. L1]|uniref:hypothetical protein n=1 Tax=Nguyenibacter sp. L1 TaxID=3049350 RepID=UPI002B476A55|nr:hypothetical protein [Nguyenibacter sp. L1]WRH89571.1 hypothetical protein QN315_08275 [Nguyenibacter sp. L1]
MRKENIKSAAAFITGVDDIIAIFWSVKRTLIRPFVRFGNMVRPEQISKLPTESTDPRERFEVAARTYSVNDAEIERRTRLSAWLFWLSAVPGIAFLWPAVSMLGDHDIIDAISAACAAVICIMLALRNGFANYQFRTRALMSFGDYMNDANLLPKLTKEKGAGK